jgi:hypothetical protein
MCGVVPPLPIVKHYIIKHGTTLYYHKKAHKLATPPPPRKREISDVLPPQKSRQKKPFRMENFHVVSETQKPSDLTSSRLLPPKPHKALNKTTGKHVTCKSSQHP